MALTYDQLKNWKPEELDAAADELNKARKGFQDQQDEMDAGKVPDTWIGQAASAAESRHRRLVADLNDMVSPLSQVINALDQAAATIKKSKDSAKHAYDDAIGRGWNVTFSGGGVQITDPTPDEEDPDKDKGTIQNLASTIGDALAEAATADTDLASVLNRATTNQYDGGDGTIEQASLPPKLRGLSDDELTKKLLADPELMDDNWETLPPEIQSQIGDYTAKKLEDLDDIDSVAERKEAEKWFSILGKHSDDRDFGEAVIDRLGPEGVNNVIHKMTGWTSSQITYPDYENPPVTIGDETMALQKLQRDGAGNLAALLGSASRGGWIDNAAYAEKIGQDSAAAAILLHAAEGRNVELGADFTHKLGTQLLETENGDPLRYSQINNGLFFGGESFMDENGDPLRQFVKVADNGIGSAQAVMGDENIAKYLMHDRLTANHMADDMDSVVRAATVDAAMEPGDTGKKAAEIASWTIDYAASEDLDEAYDEELGGIIGTYMPDTYAAIDGGAYPLPEGQEIPPFHATFNKDDLSSVLKDVGNNETATSIIGTQSGKLTQLMFDQGALASLDGRVAGADEFHPDTPGDPLIDKIGSAAGLRGYLEDQLAEGMLEGSEGDEEARRKTAELFTLPLDLIPTDKLGPVGGLAGGYLIDGIKEQVIDGYVGDPSKSAAIEGNNNYESARRATELQALYAIARAESDVPPTGQADPEVRTGADGVSRFKTEGWPTDPASGAPIPPGKLTPEQMATVLSNHQHDPGINAAVTNTVKTSWDNYQVAAGVRSE